jgi:hypothetical protein
MLMTLSLKTPAVAANKAHSCVTFFKEGNSC